MTLATITRARTVQIRQYEPRACTLTAYLAEGEDPGAVYAELLERMRALLWEATGHMRSEFAPRAAHEQLPFVDDFDGEEVGHAP